MISVAGMGNPLMDMIIHEDFSVLKILKAERGAMHLVEWDTVEVLLDLSANALRMSGGSCANTLRGISWLIGDEDNLDIPAFFGAVGRDEQGAVFEEIMKSHNVVPFLARSNVGTGLSTIIVTPDHERTMFTHLGACREFTRGDMDYSVIDKSICFHVTGYMWDTPNQEETAKESILYARKKGKIISFDVADPFVVHRYGDSLREWLPGKIDYLFGNREELERLTGSSPSDSHEEVARRTEAVCPHVIMKIGKEGSITNMEGSLCVSPAEEVAAVDTTGAGDSFAAGYLYGVLTGRNCKDCGRLANRLASRIVTVEGCNYEPLDRSEVLLVLEQQL